MFVSEGEDYWRGRWLVWRAAGPVPGGLGTCLAARARPALLQPRVVTLLTSARRTVQLPTDFDQHLARADHGFSLCLLRSQRQVRMSQQDLQREQRHLGFAMDQLDCAAGELELVDCTLIDAKHSFISPSPAVELGRGRLGQPCRIEDVG